jgi:hypothetical protein
MKTEHPLSAKAKFMALYWKQKVFIVVGDQFDEPLILDEVSIKFHQSGSLELRSIEQLNDNEVKSLSPHVAEKTTINRHNNGDVELNFNDGYGLNLYNDGSFGHGDFDNFYYDEIIIHQTLVQLGILQQFTYIHPETNKPVTISPAELIALGWAKIKKI